MIDKWSIYIIIKDFEMKIVNLANMIVKIKDIYALVILNIVFL